MSKWYAIGSLPLCSCQRHVQALLYGNWNDALVSLCRKQLLLPSSASYTLNTGIYICFKHSSDDKSKVVGKLTRLPLNSRQRHVTCELGMLQPPKTAAKVGAHSSEHHAPTIHGDKMLTCIHMSSDGHCGIDMSSDKLKVSALGHLMGHGKPMIMIDCQMGFEKCK